MIFGGYKNYLYTHRNKLSSEKKKQVKSIRYRLSLPETGSDPPIGLDRESGRDKLVSEPRFRCFWKNLCLGDSR